METFCIPHEPSCVEEGLGAKQNFLCNVRNDIDLVYVREPRSYDHLTYNIKYVVVAI